MKQSLQVIIALIVVWIPMQSQAQMTIKFRGSDGWGLASRYEQTFTNFSLQSYYGTVTKVDTVIPSSDMGSGISVLIKTDNSEELVHLGPSWFILHQDMNLSNGNKIEVKGAKVSFNGKTVIMAAEVKSKDRILYLRDDHGIPYWCAWRKSNSNRP